MSKKSKSNAGKNNIWTSSRETWNCVPFDKQISSQLKDTISKASIGNDDNVKERIKPFETKLADNTPSVTLK